MIAGLLPGLEVPPQYGWPFVTAAGLALLGYIIQKALRNKPGAPTVTEAWEETRKVRNEMDDMRAGFDVLFHLVERIARDWNKGKPFPKLTATERAILDRIRPIPEPLTDDPPGSG